MSGPIIEESCLRCLRCLRGELEAQKKISCRINEPSIIGLRFPPMAYENEEISWIFVKLAALRYLRGLSAAHRHIWPMSHRRRKDSSDITEIFCTSQDGQNRIEWAAFCWFVVSPIQRPSWDNASYQMHRRVKRAIVGVSRGVDWP